MRFHIRNLVRSQPWWTARETILRPKQIEPPSLAATFFESSLIHPPKSKLIPLCDAGRVQIAPPQHIAIPIDSVVEILALRRHLADLSSLQIVTNRFRQPRPVTEACVCVAQSAVQYSKSVKIGTTEPFVRAGAPHLYTRHRKQEFRFHWMYR